MQQRHLLITGGIVVLSSVLGASSLLNTVYGAHAIMTLITCVNFIVIARLYQALSTQAHRDHEKRYWPCMLPRTNILKYPFFRATFVSLMSYYASICLLEIISLYHLRTLYETLTDVMFIQGISTLCLGILTILFSLLLQRLLTLVDLTTILQILPYSLVILGAVSFALWLSNISLNVTLVLFLAAFTLGRSLKYTLYDSAKEIMNIPFHDEVKRSGKGIDMLGVGIGRFLAHLFPVIFFSWGGYSNYYQAYKVVALVFCCFVMIFLFSTQALGRLMNNLNIKGLCP